MPITTTVMRETRTCSASVDLSAASSRWRRCRARTTRDAVIVRPATTARIVANATAEMTPSRITPPSSNASSGAAEFCPPGAAEDAVGSDQRRGAVAEHQGEQVERADQHDRPHHRAAGLLGGRHGVEAHQHVRQARGAEHQRQRQRDEVDLRRQRARRTARRARARRGRRRPRSSSPRPPSARRRGSRRSSAPNLASTRPS